VNQHNIVIKDDALTSTAIGSSSLARLAATVFVSLFFIVEADFAGSFVLAGTVFEALFVLAVVLTWVLKNMLFGMITVEQS